jgi:acyl carrier protein
MTSSSALQQQVEKSLDMLHHHQTETARVHELFLKGQETYVQSVVQLLQQLAVNSEQLTVGSGSAVVNGLPAASTAAASITPATPPAPAAPVTKAAPVVLTPVPAPAPVVTAVPTTPASPVTAVAPEAKTAPATSLQSPNLAALADAMLVIVSEKTGYPAEMLEMGMDMESDLGIDSIKRVEILGAMQEQHPELPEVNPAELAELRTLQQIVDHLSDSLTGEPAKKLVRL